MTTMKICELYRGFGWVDWRQYCRVKFAEVVKFEEVVKSEEVVKFEEVADNYFDGAAV